MLRLGPLAVDPPLVLAPMAGITDRDFRLLLRSIGGVGLLTMEFVSARGIVHGERLARQIMVFAPEERPLAIQIYGSDPETMAEAARLVEASGADVCDVNMGCPANKVLRGCAGAALMGDLGLAEAVVRAVVRAVSIPVTVKFRLGLDDRRHRYLELGRLAEAQGASAVALHGRTARQMFSGDADWDAIARLKEALAIPVVGNGDVATADDALRLLAATGCDGVMIGRAATRNPWIFREIAARFAGGRLAPPTLADRCALVLDHLRTVAGREEGPFALHKLRLFTRWLSQGLPGGVRLRRQLSELRDPPSLLAAAERFCDELLLAEAA